MQQKHPALISAAAPACSKGLDLKVIPPKKKAFEFIRLLKACSFLFCISVSMHASAASICNDMMFWIEYADSMNFFNQNTETITIYQEGWHAIAPNDCESVPFDYTSYAVSYYVRSQETDEYLGRADWQWGGASEMATNLQTKDYNCTDVWPGNSHCDDLDGWSFVDGKDFNSSTTWHINSTVDVKRRGGYPKPKVTFGVNSATQYTGNFLNFNWTSEYATSCAAEGDWGGSRTLNDTSMQFGPLTSTGGQTYSLICSNSTTSTTKSVNVNVLAGATISQPRVTKQTPNEAYQAVKLTVDSATIDGVQRLNNVVWTSNIDGSLGQGGEITKTLSPGNHTVTARINKSATIFAQKTVSFTIESNKPHLTISAPASGRIFDLKENIQFNASVRFMGANSVGAAIDWVSDIDGHIGSGYSLNLNTLSVGRHSVTVTATQNGQTDSKTIVFTIYDRQKNQGNKNDGNCFGGNPINLLSGNKYHEETDFSTATESPLYLHRGYNSTSKETGIFGYGWDSNITERIEYNVTAQQAAVIDETGAAQRFDYANGVWVDASSSKGRLEWFADQSWRYMLYDGTVKTYNPQGQVLSVQKINGLSLNFIYNTNGQLLTVADEFGYALNFTYNTDGRIEQFTDPDGRIYRYTYDVNGNLEYVIYPDTTAPTTDNPRKRYVYENANFPHALTGIVDEEGIRFATWGYDEYGRANFSKHGLNDEQYSVIYNADGTTTTTNALGKQTNYAYKSVKGVLKISAVTGYQSANCAASFQSVTYDSATGFAAVKTDWRNNRVLLEHNEFGQVTSTTVVETGAGWTTPMDERVTSTTQYNALQLPSVITKPGLRLEQVYTAGGRIDLVTATDTSIQSVPYSTNGETRVTDYSYTLYDSSDVVHFVDINGPRTDINDTVRYEYDTKGNLIKITNMALNQSVQYQNHNDRGQPGRMIDENGLVTDYQYSPRGWLERETVHSAKGDAVAQYSYFNNGQLKTVTSANGSTLSYQYNNARQLLSVTNNLGEKQEYDPNDLNGDWKKVTYKTAAGIVRYEQSRLFDELGQPLSMSSPTGVNLKYQYDPSGNVIKTTQDISYNSVTESRVEDRYFDVFNRLRRYQGNAEAITEYGYDLAGNLTSVTVAGTQDQVTRYAYNGFGERIYENSPATGATTFYRDKTGNIIRQVNSASQETVNTYDARNRLLTVSYTGASAENISYTYDQDVNGIGRLTGVADQSGSQTLVYDDEGYVDYINYSIEGKAYSINYDFDKAGLLQKVVYPTGRQINYTRDALGRISGVTANGVPQGQRTLVSTVEYEPFGPAKTITYGNGLSREIEYDTDYRPDAITHHWFSQNEHIDYAYDTASRIRELNRALISDQTSLSSDTKVFEYDRAHRLKAARWSRNNGGSLDPLSNALEYDYDSTGNRTAQRLKTQSDGGTLSSRAWSYASDPLNNQVDAVSYAANGISYQQTDSYLYGGTGNVSSNGGRSYVYNRAQRLVEVNQNGQLAAYRYNAGGQRVRKQAGGKTIQFHYDLQGQLLAETDPTGALIREYVWLGDIPVAMMGGDKLYEGTASSSQYLVGQDHNQLSSTASQPARDLQLTKGNSRISGRLTDSTRKKGKEYLGFTLREQQDGLSGARVDVYLSALNDPKLNMSVVKTPALVNVPIITWAIKTKNEALEIDIVYPNGTTAHETLARQGDWVKLERSGSQVSIQVSADGQTWTQLRQYSLAMQDQAYIGAIASNADADIASDYMVANDNLFYLHADHLNSVYAVSSNSSKQIVWQRKDFEVGASPFGENGLPSGGSVYSGLFEMPLRFPGQYYDAETGTHYNYFRDYDPRVGRYLQSDPIGLRGGLNTYAYVHNNPVNFGDQNGQCINCITGLIVGGGAALGAYLSGADRDEIIAAGVAGLLVGSGLAALGVTSGLTAAIVANTGASLSGAAAVSEVVVGAVGSGIADTAVQLGKIAYDPDCGLSDFNFGRTGISILAGAGGALPSVIRAGAVLPAIENLGPRATYIFLDSAEPTLGEAAALATAEAGIDVTINATNGGHD
jgi:RHS repeat-associated protein